MNEKPKNLSIGEAVNAMRGGESVCRAGWNGKNMYIAIKAASRVSDMTEPYVYMKTAQGGFIPWLCSQADLLANDWMVL